jgi:cell division protein FtsB
MRKNIKDKGSFFQNIFTLAIIFLTFLFILSLVRSMGKAREVGRVIKEKEERIKKMEAKNEEVKKKLEEAKSDAYIEKKLRDDLGMAKEGEIVFILPDEEVLRSLVPPLPEEVDVLPDPIWKKWFKLFDVTI